MSAAPASVSFPPAAAGFRRALWVVAGLGLLFRLAAAVTIPLPFAGDSLSYDTFARSFAETGRLLDFDGSPLTYRPPGYPFFAGCLYFLSHSSPIAVTVAQSVIDSLLLVGIFKFLERRAGALVALFAAVLYAVSLSAIFSAGALLSESIGTALLLTSAALVVVAAERSSLALAAAAGVVGGLMTLTRSVMVFFPGVLALSLLFVTALPLRRRVALAAVLCFAYVGSLTPWLVRNVGVLGKPMLSTNAGDTLYASWVHPPGQLWGNNVLDEVTVASRKMGAVEADKFLFARAVEHLKADPVRALKLVPEKVALLLAPWDYEIVGRGQRSWNPVWPLLAVLGCWGLRKREVWRSQSGAIVWLGLLSLLATSIAFYGSPRFRVPFEALLLWPAALTLEAVLPRFIPSLRAAPPHSQGTPS